MILQGGFTYGVIVILTLLIYSSAIDSPSRNLTSGSIRHLRHNYDSSHGNNYVANKVTIIKRLLCVVFVDLTIEKVIQNLQDNIQKADTNCDWALIRYSTDRQKFDVLDSLVANSTTCSIRQLINSFVKNQNIQIYHLPEQYQPSFDESKSFQKPSLFHHILQLTAYYENIWLLDEDFSIQNFDFENYFRIWNCAFTSSARPLVTQPQVEGKTSGIFQRSYWLPSKDNVLAAPTIWVEQQAPMINAQFFTWFVKNVIQPTLSTMTVVNSDQGHDEVWCGAATAQLLEKLANQQSTLMLTSPEKDSNNQVVRGCALILGNSYVIHRNFQTIKSWREKPGIFIANGKIARRKYKSLFPTYFKPVYEDHPETGHPVWNNMLSDWSEWKTKANSPQCKL